MTPEPPDCGSRLAADWWENNLQEKEREWAGSYITSSVCHIHSSILEGYLPSIWKSANVVPVPKVHPPRSIESDLRPISLIPILAKQLESSVGEALLEEIRDTLLSGCLLEPRLCCEITSRDVFWSYIIKDNLFIVLLIEYVSSIRSIMWVVCPLRNITSAYVRTRANYQRGSG